MALDSILVLLFLFTFLRCVASDLLNLSEGSSCVTKGLNGTCVNIFKCNSAALTYLYIKAGYRMEEHMLPELPDICSNKTKEPVVCCTDCEIGEEKYRQSVLGAYGKFIYKEKGSLAREKCYEYLHRLPYRCSFLADYNRIEIKKNWIENMKCHEYKIIPTPPSYAAGWGRDAEKWEFPHIALLGYGDDVESAQWLCGGSVISERFILTAAHCTSTRALGNISFAALGLLKRSDPKNTWKIYKIKRIILHPEYKAPSKYHDIALLKTKTEIHFGSDLLPACLHVDTLYNGSLFAEAAGWGRLGNKLSLADTLQVVDLNEFNETECAELHKPHRHLKHGYDHEKQMCYGSHYDIVDTCEGDSGGPLQVNDAKCLYTVVGVTSYGKECGILGSAGVYTRVSYYVPWIEGIVWPEKTEESSTKDHQLLNKIIKRIDTTLSNFLRDLLI